MAKSRYIGYVNTPGAMFAEPELFASVRSAAGELARRARDPLVTTGDGLFVDLYFIADEQMITDAHAMREVGVPFDCPDYRITLGPRGGSHIERN